MKASLQALLGESITGAPLYTHLQHMLPLSLSSETLVSDMLGEPVDHSADLGLALAALSISASCLDWGCLWILMFHYINTTFLCSQTRQCEPR